MRIARKSSQGRWCPGTRSGECIYRAFVDMFLEELFRDFVRVRRFDGMAREDDGRARERDREARERV